MPFVPVSFVLPLADTLLQSLMAVMSFGSTELWFYIRSAPLMHISAVSPAAATGAAGVKTPTGAAGAPEEDGEPSSGAGAGEAAEGAEAAAAEEQGEGTGK